METEYLIYLKCFAVALVGMALQTILKMRSIAAKAKAANVSFKISDYFKEDWFSIAASFLTIVMFLFFINKAFKIHAKLMEYIEFIFAFVGYTGSDIASRFFSVINKRINTVIDEKTNIADKKL